MKMTPIHRIALAKRILELKSEGLPRAIIAQRLGVTVGFISTVTREAEEAAKAQEEAGAP